MSIAAGLVGLPNVGKSTLFNALTKSSIPAENYPFCTIDPHVACTMVPDARTQKLKTLYNSGKIIPSVVQFVDIAGLVKGAASGEGLGNKFLSHIREVDLILHVLRCFEDPLVIRTEDDVDPIADYETIVTELILKDVESVDKRKEKVVQSMKTSKNKNPQLHKDLVVEQELLEKLGEALNNSDVKKIQELIAEAPVKTVPLIVAKNFLIVANIAEDEVADDAYKNNKHYQALINQFSEDRVISVSAKLEHELSELDEEAAKEMAEMMGLTQPGLDTIIEKTFKNLGLITFFTCGPKEIHAWPIPQGITVRAASGEIHSDLQRGFICADVFNCNDLFTAGTMAKLKETGKTRTEGQDYPVRDGDIINVKFNV